MPVNAESLGVVFVLIIGFASLLYTHVSTGRDAPSESVEQEASR